MINKKDSMPKDGEEKATLREVYKLIDSTRTEVLGATDRIEQKVSQLESGRLTNLEKDVANMQGRLMMIPTLISIAISVFFFIINFVLNSTKN